MTVKKALALLCIIIVVAAVAAYISSRTEKQPSAPQPAAPPRASQQLWEGVGTDISFDDLLTLKGNPKQNSVLGGSGTITYPGINQYWDTTVTIENGAVSFIQEHVFKPQAVSLRVRQSGFSSSPVKIYGPFSESDQYVFSYPADGIAFLANPVNDTVYEVWYFNPTTLAGMMALPGFAGLSTSPDDIVGGR